MLLHKSGSRSKGGRCRITCGEASAYLYARIPSFAVQNYSRRWVSSVDLTERLTMITISSDASYDDHPEALCEREATRALALPNLC